MVLNIINWLNSLGDKIVKMVLNPFFKLPEIFQSIVIIIICFLSIIGLIRIVRHAFKTVVGVACGFIVLLILWVIFIK